MSKISQSIGQIRQAFIGIITRAGLTAQFKGYAGEVIEDADIYQHVGFSSWIPEDSRIIAIPLLGKSSRTVIVASSDAPVVVQVSKGETCIYDQFGNHILLTKLGVKIKGDTEIDGELKVKKSIKSDADISDKVGSIAQMRVVYNGHAHGNSPLPNNKMGN